MASGFALFHQFRFSVYSVAAKYHFVWEGIISGIIPPRVVQAWFNLENLLTEEKVA
ncbi:MAG: hypothetical protein KDD67_17560 [Ignavibacteriae bacterium]|nr:hypothetical protein [Ignavibacteriota bacterium]MCB9217474.1 hypothetical protein [Ignavibacteria bacterium]